MKKETMKILNGSYFEEEIVKAFEKSKSNDLKGRDGGDENSLKSNTIKSK